MSYDDLTILYYYLGDPSIYGMVGVFSFGASKT